MPKTAAGRRPRDDGARPPERSSSRRTRPRPGRTRARSSPPRTPRAALGGAAGTGTPGSARVFDSCTYTRGKQVADGQTRAIVEGRRSTARRRRSRGTALRRSRRRRRRVGVVRPERHRRSCVWKRGTEVAVQRDRCRRRSRRRSSARPRRSRAGAALSHSYWSASSTFSREARRAGKIAARMPTTIAAIAKTISDAPRHDERDEARRARRGARRARCPSGDPERAADQRRDHGLVADHPPHLTARHPDRAQHPELARPLEDGQDERVHDPEQADDDRQREQDVEEVQDRVEAR